MATGLTKDAGWEIGVSRTVPAPLDDVWDLLTAPAGTALWLGEGVAFPLDVGDGYTTVDGTAGEVRGYQDRRRIRLTWHPAGWTHDSTVQVTVARHKTGTAIRFHQERLADATERERQRTHWSAVLDRLVAALATGR